ncbi:MAG: ABC transporter ATP-binding protein [Pseudomonadota bacterium]
MTILEIDKLSIAFGTGDDAVTVVDGVSFKVPAEKTVALVGESGSGKSVIAQAIMGILPGTGQITGGRILLNDPEANGPIDIASLKPDGKPLRALRGNRIAIIFQEPMTSLSPLHTVGDQIGEAVRLHRGVSAPEAREITRDMLQLVQFPDPARALDTYSFELSGGLRQRAMIAMALVCRPALLIADEPTTALDVTIQAEILKLINDLQADLKMSVLMITHDFGVVANIAHEVVVIYRGKIMEAGEIGELFRDPQHDYLKALMRAVPRFHMSQSERLAPIRPIDAEPGGFLMSDAMATKQASEGQEAGAPIVEIDSATKYFTLRKGGFLTSKVRTLTALDAISLTVHRGESLGIVGESGSGKTTLARSILRAIDLDQGQVRFALDGVPRDIATFSKAEMNLYRRRVQLVFQDPFSSLNPRMTVFDILSEPYVIHEICGREERSDRIRELLSLVGLDPRVMRRYPHSFSGGQRQRIGIARSLALSPELLLLDEPVSALDVSVQAQILNLLQDLRASLGLTYIFIGHNLAVVDYISDRIAVMCKGRLVEIGPKRAITGDPRHPYTQALLAAVPEPSLDHQLDFAKLSENGASQPADWPEPFRLIGSVHPELVEVGDDHFVAIAQGASLTATKPSKSSKSEPLKEAV